MYGTKPSTRENKGVMTTNWYFTEYLIENEKHENHLVKGQLNGVDGVDKSNIFPVEILLNITFHYRVIKHFSNWRVQGVF